MGTEGQWRLSSRTDSRWQASGESLSFDGRSVPPEAKQAVEKLRESLASPPPPDLACRFHPLHKSLPTGALRQLFEIHVLAAADKLESFAALFPEGEEGGPKLLPEQGELIFLDWDDQPRHRFKAQVIGTEWPANGVWQWAWHLDEFPDELTRTSRRLHKFGVERRVAEFVNRSVPLGTPQDRPWFNGDFLALTALGLAGADAHYVLEADGKKIHLLLTVPGGLPAPESVPVRMGVVLRTQFSRWGEAFPAQGHRRAVRTYSQLNKCRLQEVSESHFELYTASGELLHVHFEATGAFHTFECPTDETSDRDVERLDIGSLETGFNLTGSSQGVIENGGTADHATAAGWWKVICHSDSRWNCSGPTQSRDEFCTPPEADDAIERLQLELGATAPPDIEIEFQPVRGETEEYLDLAPLDARPSVGLRTLFAAHAARSHEKQLQLANYMAGEVPEWKLLLEEGLLRLNLKERRARIDLEIQFLGLVSYRRETQWQWAWSDLEYDIPPALLQGVQKLRRLGQQNDIPELSEPHFPLGPESEQPWFNGNYLSLLASGVCGADFFYSIPWDDKVVLYLLVHNSEVFPDPSHDAAEMTRTLRDLLQHWGTALPLESHVQMIQAYTRQTGCAVITEQTDKREFSTPRGDTLRVLFEHDGRIGSVEFSMQGPRLPDLAPGSVSGTAVTRPLEAQATAAGPRGTGAMHLVKKLLGRGQPAARDYLERAAVSLTAGDWEAGHADLCEAIRLEPNNPTAWQARGEAWLEHGENIDQALADLQEALMRGHPTASLLTSRARAWLRKQQFEQAVTDCNEAIRLDADFALAYFLRGEASAELGLHEQALDNFLEYSLREPFDFQPFVLGARSRRLLNDTAGADRDEARARELGWNG